jgi:hypothetical protein
MTNPHHVLQHHQILTLGAYFETPIDSIKERDGPMLADARFSNLRLSSTKYENNVFLYQQKKRNLLKTRNFPKT